MGLPLITTIAVSALMSGIATLQTLTSREARSEHYQSATIDGRGNLAIMKSNGQRLTVRKRGEQTAFSPPVLSSQKTAVGAQAMFANCCTSYDIPLELVVYAAGRVHRFRGIDLPIFQWGFVDGGTRVAYGQEPVHFGCSTHYELRDIDTERLIEAVDVPQPCGQIPNPKPVPIPLWVGDLIAKK
jgi:hypothetical protein